MYLQQIRIYSDDTQYLPAIQALTRDTQVPVNKALSTKAEMSLFLVGQMEAVTTNIIDIITTLLTLMNLFITRLCYS